MAQPLTVNLAEELDLPDGYQVTWAAIDAAGADVSGVVVSGVSIFGTALGSGLGAGSGIIGPFMLVPGPNA